jgi:riboflavin synthase
MFTGLVEKTKIAFFERDQDGASIKIFRHPILASVAIGDSIAIDGTCLTANELNEDTIGFFASNETLSKTRIQHYHTGFEVNFELPLRAGQHLGGHYVLGHVDTVSTVKSIDPDSQAWTIKINIPQPFEKYVVYKGSIAVNGTSLTINKVDPGSIELCIIPVTLEKTNFGNLAPDDLVNLEFDILAKYTEKLLISNHVQ